MTLKEVLNRRKMNFSTTPYICNRCIRSLSRNIEVLQYSRTKSILPQRRRYTSKPIEQDGRPFRMAIIGSGPAGFYTALRVMSKIENAKIDMYEHLPTPFGLVRYGVAPDHPEVKNCQERFEEVAESPHFNFVGNINIGNEPSSLPLKYIVPHYDAILFAYGASKDKRLYIPGEDLKGIYSARAFVGWYNGLPEYADLNPDLSLATNAAVIGQGNVALDVTRILLSDVGALRKTDITEEALEVLSKSKVRKVSVIGRRGPAQAAFTIKEIRELLSLPNVAFQPVRPSLLPSPEELKSLPRAQKRILQLLQKGSEKTPFESSNPMTKKSWSLDFLLTPTYFSTTDPSTEGDASNVSHIICQSNCFEGSTLEEQKQASMDPNAKVKPIDIQKTVTSIDAQVAFRSIGYKSEALSGFEDHESRVPFDEKRGIIWNDGVGRVIDPSPKDKRQDATVVPGMYCAGWVKRGPTGVIASTMADAFATADAIARDWFLKSDNSGVKFLEGGSGDGWEGVRGEAEKRGCRRISWEDWKKIDGEEKRKGRLVGKERVKFRRVEDMLAVLD